MESQELDYFKEQISNKIKETKELINSMHKNDTFNPSNNSELSNYDNHPADTGTQLYEFEHNNALKAHQELLIKNLEDSLNRIEKGGFGKCVYCGKDIDIERLKILPQATLCIDCADDESRENSELINKPPYFEQELKMEHEFNTIKEEEFESINVLNDALKHGSSDTPQDMGVNKDLKGFYTNEYDYQGIVDPMDNFSNEDYLRQLP